MAVRSRSFDRAAPFYDRTRGLPAHAVARVTELLAAELSGRGPCLEVGVGTGRVALPLHEAGITMTGVDLSRPMMQVLIDKAGGHLPFPLAEADATRLPFPDGQFGAVVASHVLHLIPNWREAIDEVVRVVQRGGLFLSSRGDLGGKGALGEVHAEFRAHLGADVRHVGAGHGSAEVETTLAGVGARERLLPAVRATGTMTAATMIESLEAGEWSWAWGIPEARRREAGVHTREWARARFGPLEDPVAVESKVVWRAFDLP